MEVLQPGSRSSNKHWHSAEDEMVYVLEGEITLIERRHGDCVTSW
ncbi:MAG: cupin domain-containing protein [Leptolyngbyaceae cyanobacterium HOT.MB2.61]|nr:cupin domain-containing protein [Leptolyngbyaceae cyanobacterium HOT.MB2.61]